MRLATVMWGGQMCPLIPVMKRRPSEWSDKLATENAQQISRGLIRFFEPDLLVQTAADQLDAVGVKREPNWLGSERFIDIGDILTTDKDIVADFKVGANISQLYRHLFAEEFQFQKRFETRAHYFSEGTSSDTAFFEAAYGFFPKDKRLSYIQEDYIEVFAATEKPPTFETWLELAANHADFPQYFTICGSDIVYADRSDPTIFILDPDKGTDLIDFWNYRLFTRDVLPVNINWLDKSRDVIINAINAYHRPLPMNPNGVMINTRIQVGRILDLADVLKRLDLTAAKLPKHSVSVQGWYEPIWREPEVGRMVSRPGASIMSTKSRQVQLTPSEGDPNFIQFPVQAPDFKIPYRGSGPGFVNVVNVRSHASAKDIAATIPAATFNSRAVYPVRGSDQFVSREGFVTFHRYVHDDAFLKLPSPYGAILTWLAAKGIEATPSDAGRVGEQVIESVGGLRGTTILRERSILEQLNKMPRSRTEWNDGSADEYSDKAAPVHTWLQTLKPINKKLFGKWKTLSRLVDDGVLQLGLSPRCPYCTQENWYSLDEVGNEVSCIRCLKRFQFPQGSPNRNLFKYRVVGPFASPGYAGGGYSVALT
jgi:hypothetical protein